MNITLSPELYFSSGQKSKYSEMLDINFEKLQQSKLLHPTLKTFSIPCPYSIPTVMLLSTSE